MEMQQQSYIHISSLDHILFQLFFLQILCPTGTYCYTNNDGAVCTDEVPTTTPCSRTDTTAPSFICTSPGYYPDPSNCRVYYFCAKLTTTPVQFLTQKLTCPNLYVFDPTAPGNDYCRYTANQNCVTADCIGKAAGTNVLMKFPTLPIAKGQYVVTCLGTALPIVTRCGEGSTADLSTIPPRCKVNCIGPANYPYITNDTKYYECFFNGRTWDPVLKSCEFGKKFNSNTKKCEN